MMSEYDMGNGNAVFRNYFGKFGKVQREKLMKKDLENNVCKESSRHFI